MTYTRSYHHDLAPEHECNDADIENLIAEIVNLRNDPTIERFENPMATDMHAILARAEKYHGPWYHTTIIFDMDTPVTDTYRAVRERLLKLPSTSGVSITTRYDVPGLDAIFARD